MKTRHLLMVLALLPMARYGSTALADDEQPTAAATPHNDARMAEYVDAIRHAPDPSSAVAAYTQAITADRTSLAPVQAYVHRMIELGTPEMAYEQARFLSQRQPSNGLAWGIIADVDARKGQFVTALSDIASAVRYAPNDPFVQRTAAGLLAWFDTTADQSQVSADLKHSLAALRAQLEGEKTFAGAYSEAKDFYGHLRIEQSQAGSVVPPEPESRTSSAEPTQPGNGENASEVYVAPGSTTYIYDYGSYPLYGYDYGFYPAFPIYGGYPYFGRTYWWPVTPFCYGGGRPCIAHRGLRFDGFGVNGGHDFRGINGRGWGRGDFSHGSLGGRTYSGFGRAGGSAGPRSSIGGLETRHSHSSLSAYGGRGLGITGGGSHGFRSTGVGGFGGRSSANLTPRASPSGRGSLRGNFGGSSFGGRQSFGSNQAFGGSRFLGSGRSFGGSGFHSSGGGAHFGGSRMGHTGGGRGRR